MLRHERSAPIWLFSFVDLAFLLLIAFTQISPKEIEAPPAFAELEIPQISGSKSLVSPDSAIPRWQLRVYPTDPSETGNAASESTARPYALIEGGQPESGSQPVGLQELEAHLEVLRKRSTGKPILAPHRDARAEDLLVAVSLLEDIWTSKRTVAVRPLSAVSAPPDDPRP